MSDIESGNGNGNGYRLVPFAERCGDIEWHAGVVLNTDGPRGIRETRSTYCQPFASKEEALRYARSQCEQAFWPEASTS